MASRVACAQLILQRVESGRSRLLAANAMLEAMATSQARTPILGGNPTVLTPATMIESEVSRLLVVVRDLRRLQIASLAGTAIPDEDLFDEDEGGHLEDFDFEGNDDDAE